MHKAQVWAEECTRTSGWTRVGGKFMDEESGHDWGTQGSSGMDTEQGFISSTNVD